MNEYLPPWYAPRATEWHRRVWRQTRTCSCCWRCSRRTSLFGPERRNYQVDVKICIDAGRKAYSAGAGEYGDAVRGAGAHVSSGLKVAGILMSDYVYFRQLGGK